MIEGEVDISLGRWENLPDAVESSVVQKEGLVVALPVSHELANRKLISMRQLRNEAFIALPPNS
ncbi:LysR substrate-binding domain-containing protein [Corynebacterium suranareeae]|uniref:LysR substrate-binding domain-containing protein n=1 Tax=Corynebacterium suranareeae TaxID=2506452 RepID=UPI001E4A1226|nr:LysR substrate-binding domain-containing protein [Corynebacterium suranareeae]